MTLFLACLLALQPGPDGDTEQAPWQCEVISVTYHPLDADSGYLSIWTVCRVPKNTPARIEIQIGEIADDLEYFRILHSEYIESVEEWHVRYCEAEVGRWIDPHIPPGCAGAEVRAILTDYSLEYHPTLEDWQIWLK